MKKKIFSIILEFLHVFLIVFSFEILFAYFRSKNINVPEELLDSAVNCVIILVLSRYWGRKKKSQKADENAGKAE